MSNQGSLNNLIGNSIERKTTQGTTSNNSVSNNNISTAKKKKIQNSSNNSRNNTHMKYSQSSMTLVNGSNFNSANGGSDKKTKITN